MRFLVLIRSVKLKTFMRKYLLVALICLPGWMSTYGQKKKDTTDQKRVTVNYNNSSLSDVLKDLEKQTNYEFAYADDCMRHTRRITLIAKNVPLDSVLNVVFDRQPVFYIPMRGCYLVSPFDITGKVIDELGRPIEYAIVQGIQKDTQTGKNGEYTLKYASCDSFLIFSRVGFEPVSIPV